MTCRLTAICDVCGVELVLKANGPISEAQYERELNMEGWWQRSDAVRDVCTRHPAPVAGGS